MIMGGQRFAARLRERFTGDVRGQVSVIFGLAAVAITGMVGTGMDAAAMNRSATQLQDAVDAAALHGVQAARTRKLSDDEVEAATVRFVQAAYDSADSSDTYGAASASVTASVTSRSPNTVEVTATRKVQMPFGFLRGEDGATFTRTASAVEADEAPVALLLLAGNSARAWSASGSSSVKVENGVAVVISRSE